MFRASAAGTIYDRRALLRTELSGLTACAAGRSLPSAAGEPQESSRPARRPVIERLGTIDFGVNETTPIVFRKRLYRLEYINRKYHRSSVPDDYFRLIDVGSGEIGPGFALGHHLGSAFVDGSTMYVFGLEGGWGGDSINVFTSQDLQKWSSKPALRLKEWQLYNNSVCRGDEGYVMAIEAGSPQKAVGVQFTCFFARSSDLRTWNFLGEDVSWGKDRYIGCPTIRFHRGRYYVFYLNRSRISDGADKGRREYDTHVVRSRDLKQWETSPLNPVLTFSEQDRRICNPSINPEQQQRIAKSPVLNVSDLDLCEFDGHVVFYYSWGSQRGIEYLAEARYDGTLATFLDSLFLGR